MYKCHRLTICWKSAFTVCERSWVRVSDRPCAFIWWLSMGLCSGYEDQNECLDS